MPLPKIYVVEFGYEQFTDEKQKEVVVDRRTTKFWSLCKANKACRRVFHDIVCYDLDWSEHMHTGYLAGCDDLESYNWVDEQGGGGSYSADEDYGDEWKWSAWADVIRSGHYSRKQARCILLCLRRKGLCNNQCGLVLRHLGIFDCLFKVAENAIEPY